MGLPRPRVLVLDDDVPFARLVADVLQQKGYDTSVVHNPEAAREAAAAGGYDAAVFDLRLQSGSGLDLVEPFRAGSPDAQVVVLTGQSDLQSAIAGIERGVFAFLEKGSLDLGQLEHAIAQAVARAGLLREKRALVARLEESNRLMRALQEHGARLSEETHLDRFLPRLVEAAKALAGAPVGRLILFQRSTGGEVLVVEHAVGDGTDGLQGARLQPGDGLSAQVADHGEAILLEDAPGDSRFSYRCDDFGAASPAFCGVPLTKGTVLGALVVAGPPGCLRVEHASVLASLARQAALIIHNARDQERGVNFFVHVSDLLVQVLERLDIHYPGHSQRVAALADMVSRRMGLDEADRRPIHFGALLHDIGKIRIDAAVLNSAGVPSEVRSELERHPAYGLEILRSITAWEGVLPVVHAHHERWDGKGYPRGLAGEEIPLGARIVSVADAFDAMTRDTPHGRRKTEAEGLRELEACAGTQFDARVVRLFVSEFEKHGHPLPEDR